MKLNDLYRFQYHYKEGERDRYWCFDGKLVVKARSDGTLYLHDTYWGGSGGRTFTPEEAAEQGTLTFVCNLDEVEKIEGYQVPLYAEGDVFNLSHQHNCYPSFAKRKGALRSRDATLAHLRRKLEEAHDKLRSAAHNVEWQAKELARAEAMDQEQLEKAALA